MMRRRGIFAGLYGLIGGVFAAAQVNNPDRPRSILAEGWKRKPDNNECPVCGTVAAPFKIDIKAGLPACAYPQQQYMDNMGISMGQAPTYNGPHNEGVDCSSRVSMVTLRYDENCVRCKFCNSLFVQDAVSQ